MFYLIILKCVPEVVAVIWPCGAVKRAILSDSIEQWIRNHRTVILILE